MFKQLAYLGLGAGAIATMVAVGCGGGTTTNTNFDFSHFGDGGGPAKTDGSTNSDMHANVMYTATTPHEIDTAVIGSPLNDPFAPVKLTGVIVLAPPSGFSAKINATGDACRYEVWVQDPTCTTPPCGLLVETNAIVNPNGTGMFCPYASQLDDPQNVLKDVWEGDELTLEGVMDNFPHTGAPYDGGAAVQLQSHGIELDSATITSKDKGVPPATVVTDTDPSMFQPYAGAGWSMYEGMYITLKPTSGKFTTTLNTSSNFSNTCTGVTGKTNGSFTTAPGGAEFADTYSGFYIQKDAGEMTNCWPTNGLTFSSISGIVSTSFGGSILPTSGTDFKP